MTDLSQINRPNTAKIYRIGFRFDTVWRAVTIREPGMDLTPVFTDDGVLYVLSADPGPSSFKSPKVALSKYFEARQKII
jgi:hypothetical protein